MNGKQASYENWDIILYPIYFLPQGVASQDQGITVTDTEISGMTQEADWNTDQECSAGAVDSKFQSNFDYIVQNENTAYPPDNGIQEENITTKTKDKFPLGISPVNLTKSAVSCGFGHIYWRNP